MSAWFPDDVSPWVRFNTTPGSADIQAYEAGWGSFTQRRGRPISLANATQAALFAMEGSYMIMWPVIIAMFVAALFGVAWVVRSLPEAVTGFDRKKAYSVSCLGGIVSPSVGGGICRRFCCGSRNCRVSLRRLMETSEKVLDTCKLVSALFILLSASSIATTVCDTPSVLLQLPGWGAQTMAPSYLSGSRVDPSRLVNVLGYTKEQVHAVFAVYSSMVDYRYFLALYYTELLAFTVFIGTWSAVKRERWSLLYASSAFCLALVWACYETQMYSTITLHDNGEVILCNVPYLSVITRSFSYLHLMISAFYFGIALGRTGLCTRCLGVRSTEIPVSRSSTDGTGSAVSLGRKAVPSENGSNSVIPLALQAGIIRGRLWRGQSKG